VDEAINIQSRPTPFMWEDGTVNLNIVTDDENTIVQDDSGTVINNP
jgi:hypothetical protein